MEPALKRLAQWEQLHPWFKRELTDTQRGRGGDGGRKKERAMRQGKKEGERERKEGKEALSLIPNSASILYTPNGGPILFIGIFFFLLSVDHCDHYHRYLVKRNRCEMSSVTSTSTPSTTGCVQSNQVQGNGLSSGMSSVGGGSPVSAQSGPHHNTVSTPNNGGNEQLSRTNLYIRGLPQTTTDKDLLQLCGQYGTIISTKAILDKNTNKCKGSFSLSCVCFFFVFLRGKTKEMFSSCFHHSLIS